MSKNINVILCGLASLLLQTPTYSEEVKGCSGFNNTNKTYKITGSDIPVRKGPNKKSAKIINEKATKILKKTHYITVDNTVTVREECSNGKWSKVKVTEPDYLSSSHQGWIQSKFLRGKKTDSTGTEVFTEQDFLFDKKTRKHKKIIIKGVNKIHRENSKCKDIDTASAYLSGSKGTKSDPVFYVTCGKGSKVFNVFFSKSDVEKNKTFGAKKHIKKSKATRICEDYAKSKATHPSTVDFSKFLNLSSYETPNGRTRISSTFTAKNSLNLELEYNITCLFNDSGLIEANINEKQ